MDLRLNGVNSIDRKAVFPVAFLIHSFLQNHNNVGCVEVCENEIAFTKAVFFKVGKILYVPYGLECCNKIIYYDGSGNFTYPHDKLFNFLVNALMSITPGHLAKI